MPRYRPAPSTGSPAFPWGPEQEEAQVNAYTSYVNELLGVSLTYALG